MHTKSDAKKIVRQAFCIVKNNTKSMLALSQQTVFSTKIDEKSHVFGDIDSMCCARTAALQGETKSQVNAKAIFMQAFVHC